MNQNTDMQKNKLMGLKVSREVLTKDLIAGLVMSIVTVPGALANGLLAGINPVYGVYSMIAGTTVAALFTSSVIMNVDSTSATSIATGDFLVGITVADVQVQQSNFHDYPILRFDDMPVVEVQIVPSEDRPRGVGEIPVPPLAPAVLNAIYPVTGVRIRQLPITPRDLINY